MPLSEKLILDGRRILLSQVGKRYIFGHEVELSDPDPLAFDCSELVQWLFWQLGFKDVPDGSYNQYDYSKPVVERMPLDLGFYRNDQGVHHVGISYDDIWVVHAKSTVSGVVKEPVWKFEEVKDFSGWRRPLCLLV